MQNRDTFLLSEIYTSQILNEIKYSGANRGRDQHMPAHRKAYGKPSIIPHEHKGVPSERLSHDLFPDKEPEEDSLLQKVDFKRTFKLGMIDDLKYISQGRDIVRKLLANEPLVNKLLDEIISKVDTQTSVDFESGDLFFKYKDDDNQEHQLQVELSTDPEGNVVNYNIF